MGCYPNGTLAIEPEDDKVWGHLAERGVPLGIHVSLSLTMPAAHKAKLPGYGRFFDAPNRMIELIFAGVFDRFPDLDVVFAEVDFGWVPYAKEQIDNNYQRLEPVSRFGLQTPPSEYIERHFHFGFMTDTFGLHNREYVGAERILWSNDYPHISADWPTRGARSRPRSAACRPTSAGRSWPATPSASTGSAPEPLLEQRARPRP